MPRPQLYNYCESSDKIMAKPTPGEFGGSAAASKPHRNCSNTNHFLSLSEHLSVARGGSPEG
jgi:hypothetical protein